jgi:hypothetical protein
MEATSDLFEQLPKEIKLAICDYLLPNDLSRACCVCPKWNLLMGSDLLWRKFVLAKKSGKNSGTSIVQDKQEAKPFKWIYINRKVNWLHGEVEKFTIPGNSEIGRSFYIAHMLSGSNIMLTGGRDDVMLEWDLAERKLLKSYEVPTGPASSYRMDDTSLVINRNDLKRWKRHEHSTAQGKPEEFDFSLSYPDSSHDSYKFVKERLLIADAANIKLYDMNTGQQMWANNWTGLDRLAWNGLDMDYNRGLRAGKTLNLLDLNNNGKEILRINLQEELPVICKLEDNLVCWATTKEVSMIDLRNPEHKLWSTEVEDNSSYLLKKIYFDEFKCIAGMSGQLKFFDTQTGKLLYSKDVPGLIDFVCNDEYLGVLAGRVNCIFDFTKRHVSPVVEYTDEVLAGQF